MLTKTIEVRVRIKRALVEAGVTVKFGIDVHASQITVCRQVDGQAPQRSQRLGWRECVEVDRGTRESGAVVHSCYEAGPNGYGLPG